MAISALYLAAGESRRMGARKQRLELAMERSLAGMALYALLLSRLEEIVVVVRPDDRLEWLTDALRRFDCEASSAQRPAVHVEVCDQAMHGMSKSIRSGLQLLLRMRPELDAALVTLADQPFITGSMIDRLVDYWHAHPQLDYAASSVKDEKGEERLLLPPAVLKKTMFAELMKLSGDEGARKLFKLSRFTGAGVEPPDRMCLFDVDTPEDLAIARQYYQSGFSFSHF